MSRDHPRARRIGDQMQRDLSVLVRDEIKDPRLGMVTISAVEVTRDLACAKVYVTVLGDEQERKASLAVLNRAAGFLRRLLAQRMVLRTVPQLRFIYDESIERGERLSKLIDSVAPHDDDQEGQEEKD